MKTDVVCSKCGFPIRDGFCGSTCDGRADGISVKIGAGDEQPNPVVNKYPCIQDMVIEDIEARKNVGIRRYGTTLQPFNGRDVMLDAYQEALDLCIYLRQAIYERDHAVDDQDSYNPGYGYGV